MTDAPGAGDTTHAPEKPWPHSAAEGGCCSLVPSAGSRRRPAPATRILVTMDGNRPASVTVTRVPKFLIDL